MRSRTGAFLSSDDRFHNGPFDEKNESGPGPGDYGGAAEGEQRKAVAKQVFPRQSSFLSHTDRFVEQEKPVPPPGTYDLSTSWKPKNTTLASNKSFASSAARFNPKEVFTGVMMKEVPAPGEYDRIKTEGSQTDAHKGFLSTENRFAAGKKQMAPGLGLGLAGVRVRGLRNCAYGRGGASRCRRALAPGGALAPSLVPLTSARPSLAPSLAP